MGKTWVQYKIYVEEFNNLVPGHYELMWENNNVKYKNKKVSSGWYDCKLI